MSKMVRVNTNVTSEINEWLNARSERTGISKSALILMALDQYRGQVEVISELPKITAMMEMFKNPQLLSGMMSAERSDS